MKSQIGSPLLATIAFALCASGAAFAENEEALECERECRADRAACVEICWDTEEIERCGETCRAEASACVSWCH